MSSLVFLGFSIIIFVVAYGVMFLVAPAILGQFFSILGPAMSNVCTEANPQPGCIDPDWAATYTETEGIVRWLIPLIPTVGIFILVIKVLMAASTRGGDGY